jgi:hypothetical protein
MRFLALVAAGSVALAGTGCTALGAGTGVLAAVTANHFIDPASPHRIPVGVSAGVGAAMGFIIDMLVISALDHALEPLHSDCASCD